MHNPTRKQRTDKAAFTMTELLVLVGVGAVLTSVVLADFSQTRLQLLQQSCAANLKQWGMAFALYANDYNGCIFGSWEGTTFNWDNTANPYGNSQQATNLYFNYLGGGGNVVTTIRTLRTCPFLASRYSPGYLDNPGIYGYSMTDPQAIGIQGSKIYRTVNDEDDPNGVIYITTKTIRYPAQFLLLVDAGSKYFVSCDGAGSSANLTTAVTTPPANDTIRPIDRHGGGVNCLFADQHVSWMSYSNIVQQSSMVPCGEKTPNPWFAEN
jgi:prepilin-type processing-associated H-X9-DG protein